MQIVGGAVNDGLSGQHVAGLIEIIPFFVQLHPLGNDGLSILAEVVPVRRGGFRRIHIFLVSKLDPLVLHHFSVISHVIIFNLLVGYGQAVFSEIVPVFSVLSPGVCGAVTVFIIIYERTVFFYPAIGSCIGAPDSVLTGHPRNHGHACSGRKYCKETCLFFHNCFSPFFDARLTARSVVVLRADYNRARQRKSSAGCWQKCQSVTETGVTVHRRPVDIGTAINQLPLT